MRSRTFRFVLTGLLCADLLSPVPLRSTPEFAERTAQGCQACHLDTDGGELTRTGLEFAASGYVWPPKGGYRVLGPIRRTVRFGIGFLHILAAFMWFGTILYVHILLRPAYASKGLPRGEVAVGIISMVIVGLSGTLLTISRIRSIDVLFASPWGILLSLKILLYLVMVSSALLVILFVGPRLKPGARKAALPPDALFDPLTLASFDGREGRPSYVALGGNIYDLTGSPLWKEGTHMKHRAGGDLTDALSRAPHGEEKLEPFLVPGRYDSLRQPPRSPVQKAFYLIAYMNLTLVFAVLFVIAFWRWGM